MMRAYFEPVPMCGCGTHDYNKMIVHARRVFTQGWRLDSPLFLRGHLICQDCFFYNGRPR